MIEALVGFSVAHRRSVFALTLLLAALGSAVGVHLRMDALPDVTTNQVIVLTNAPGLTPEEVERLITRPIETALSSLPGAVAQRSQSRYGLSSVTVVFDDAVEPQLARQQATERLTGLRGTFPDGVHGPDLAPLTGGLGEIFHFTLSSPDRTPAELLELALWQVAPILRGAPGVVEINTWGGEQRTWDVVADPAALAQRGLTLSALRDAVARSMGVAPGAALAMGDGQALLRGAARPRSLAEIGAAGVGDLESPRGPPTTRIADVASLREGALPRIGAATADGAGEVVYVMVQMLREANALEVMAGVHARMDAARAALPPDVRLGIAYDRSVLVGATVRTVLENLGTGGLLVVAVLFVMLGSFRAGLLAAVVIPLSMLGATAGMVLLGIPGNLMSLGALDFGLLVDGAVIMVEAAFFALHRPLDATAPSDPPDREAQLAVIEPALRRVARPVFFSVLVIGMVYVPILSLTGVDGRMFRPMAATVILALATSLLLSLTFVPAAVAMFIRPQDVPARHPLLVRLATAIYAPMLRAATRWPWAVVGGALGLLGLSGWLFARAGTDFVPQLDEGDLVIQTTREPDISIEAAVRRAGEMERALRRLPEVQQVVSRIGSPAVATDIMGLEQADVFVGLHPRSAWRAGLTREALIAEMAEVLADADPGSDPAFSQPIQMRFNELIAGATTDVALSIYGEDLDTLRRLAEAARDALEGLPGAEDVRVIGPPAVPLVEVRPRAWDAERRGLSTADVLESVQTLQAGLEIGHTYQGPVRVPVRLRLDGDASPVGLAELRLPTHRGTTVPLASVAEIAHLETPGVVSRESGQRRLVVGFNVRGRDLGAVVSDAMARFSERVALPPGYRPEWGGQYAVMREATARMAVVLPVVGLAIFLLLFAAFHRWGLAALIFLNVPFSCVGGMIALTVRDMPVSISATVGFIALSGLSVLDGVVLMNRLLAARAEGLSRLDAAIDAARSRMRPVIITAMVAGFGFLPMALNTSIGAEVQRPLATVVLGGLVTSTALTLLVLPALYAIGARWTKA